MNRRKHKGLLALAATALLVLCGTGSVLAQQSVQADIKIVPADEQQPQGSYIGVKVREVPEALAMHLGLQAGQGVMVQTVIEDSPAAGAGIEEWDIILQADGKDVRSAEALVGVILPKQPGQAVKLKLIHRGQEIERQIAVSKRPEDLQARDGRSIQLQGVPVVTGQDLKLLRGQVEVTPEGKVRIRFGDDGEAAISEDIQKLLKKSLSGASGLIGGTRAVSSVSDGVVLTVRKRPDGQFEVTRTSPGREGNPKLYKDLDALKEGDARAHKLYTSWVENHQVGAGILGRLEDLNTRRHARQELRKLTEKLERFQSEFSDHPDMEKFKKLAKEGLLSGRFKGFSDPALDALEKSVDGSVAEKIREHLRGLAGAGSPVAEKPNVLRKFDVDPQGKVTVHITNGGNDLTQSFQNLEEMKEKAPQLHEHYRRLLNAE